MNQSKQSNKYQHIQPKISSFRASSRKSFREGQDEQGLQINIKPKIPASRVKPSSKQNKDTFVMLSSRNSINNANHNFE
jgi:hypothetical protein